MNYDINKNITKQNKQQERFEDTRGLLPLPEGVPGVEQALVL